MPVLETYLTRGANTFAGRELARCPICRFPQRNGFQLTCEPGVCMYRETPLRYRCDKIPAKS